MKNLMIIFVVAVFASSGLYGRSLADETSPSPIINDGYYTSVFAGAAFLKDITHGYTHTIATENGKTRHGIDSGYNFGIALGTYLLPNVRGELEISHSINSVSSQTFDNPAFVASSGPATGSVKVTNLLANAWYDFSPQAAFRPYIGGGIGASLVDGNSLLAGTTAHEFNDSDIAFAFQAGVGAKFAVAENIDFDIGYRFKGISNVRLKTEIGGQVNKSASIFGHFIQIGITLKLNGM